MAEALRGLKANRISDNVRLPKAIYPQTERPSCRPFWPSTATRLDVTGRGERSKFIVYINYKGLSVIIVNAVCTPNRHTQDVVSDYIDYR